MVHSRSIRLVVAGTVAVAGVSMGLFAQSGSAPLPLNRLKLPAGFHISVFAEGVPSAREMVMGPKGTLFVGARTARQVYAIRDRNGDHKADDIKVIPIPYSQPSGVAIRNGALYVTAVTRVLRFDDIEDRVDNLPAPVIVSDRLPSQGGHTWRFTAFGPDGLLYIGMGAPCNVCESDDERLASIVRMKSDGTSLEVFAHGVRDTVGFDWHPTTHELWFTDNGRDDLGDDIPNDELNVAPTPGLHFGFPYCHQGDIADPVFGAKKPCAETTPPVQKMGPHVAAIGMRFYTGQMFPADYRNAIFIAQHGSWNRSQPIGYRVMVAKVDGRKVTSYEPFVDGFLQGIRGTPSANRATGDAFARPSDVMVMPDGSLLISDDQGGRIFRVSYGK
jgi:glucose/arabinose dehydrogenase